MKVSEIQFSREWAMPCADTFDIPPIHNFVQKYLRDSKSSIDPFARNKDWATYTNDLDPNTSAQHHMDAVDYLEWMGACLLKCDLGILDMPYSPRQISECYQEAGIKCGMAETQNAALYSKVKTALLPLLAEDAIVLSFGWNSAGMGKKHGFAIIEILMVCHGGAHNDTICVAERRIISPQNEFAFQPKSIKAALTG